MSCKLLLFLRYISFTERNKTSHRSWLIYRTRSKQTTWRNKYSNRNHDRRKATTATMGREEQEEQRVSGCERTMSKSRLFGRLWATRLVFATKYKWQWTPREITFLSAGSFVKRSRDWASQWEEPVPRSIAVLVPAMPRFDLPSFSTTQKSFDFKDLIKRLASWILLVGCFEVIIKAIREWRISTHDLRDGSTPLPAYRHLDTLLPSSFSLRYFM